MGSTQQLINQLESSVSTFNQKMDVELRKVDTAADEIQVTTNKIYQKVETFKDTLEKQETVQLAFENKIRIDQELEEKIKFYRNVRRTIVGVVHDYDVNLVSNKNIADLSEELWMGASKYWLSYALIAISAWLNNDEELANNALKLGMQRDPVNFSLFFALFNMKFGKSKVSKHWLILYFNMVDPKNPGNELAVLLQAYLGGAFGNDAQLNSFVRKSIESWQMELDEDPNISEELKKGYYEYIVNKKGVKAFNSEVLNEHCTNINEFKNAYIDVAKFDVLKKEIDAITQAPVPDYKGDLKSLIDETIDQLINLPDEEEQKLLDEKKYNELIMEAEGDIEVAEKQYKQYLDLKGKEPNIGKTMLRWVLYTNAKEISSKVKKFSLYQTKSWYVESFQKLMSEQKVRRPHMFELKVDIWSGPVDGSDKDKVEKSLENTMNTDKISSTVFRVGNIVGILIALVIGLVAIPVVKMNQMVGLIMFGVAAVLALVIIIITLVSMSRYPRRIAKAKTVLGKCFDEIKRYNNEYNKLEEDGSNLVVELYNMATD